MILQISQNCSTFHGALEPLARACLAVASSARVPVALHLDHAEDERLVLEAIGLGFGDNTTASVITRGLAEIARLANRCGADPMTLSGLAGLGDLVASCSSPLSRNRTFGEKLGQGMTAEEITASTRQVAEGVKSCASLLELARRADVYAPIVENVHAVIEGELTAADMLTRLISRDTKDERD